MKYLSICSGIEAASVAWQPLGWEAVGFSEIDPFPAAVLAHRFPHVPNFGDMTKFKEWKIDGSIDLICGGTPCQAFSVAGRRGGLDDPRGNLMLTFGHILARFRPRWFVWENVPGVLSSGDGRDFASFMGLVTGQSVTPPANGWQRAGVLGGIGSAYSVAWRVIDAQFTQTHGFPRAVPQRRERVWVVGHLGADWRRAAGVLFDGRSLHRDNPPRRETGKGLTRPDGTGAEVGGGKRLSPWEGGPAGDETQNLVVETISGADVAAFENHEMDGRLTPTDVAVTLRAGAGPKTGIPAPTTLVVTTDRLAVRRLTVTECERLMGFPDGWTRIPWRGKPAEQCPNGRRYKALGNSWAVNCAEWIGRRIQMMDDLISDHE